MEGVLERRAVQKYREGVSEEAEVKSEGGRGDSMKERRLENNEMQRRKSESMRNRRKKKTMKRT